MSKNNFMEVQLEFDFGDDFFGEPFFVCEWCLLRPDLAIGCPERCMTHKIRPCECALLKSDTMKHNT